VSFDVCFDTDIEIVSVRLPTEMCPVFHFS